MVAGRWTGLSRPWGTTYPANLRKYFGEITGDEWAATASTLKTRPPLPRWTLNAMTEEDLTASYAYIKDQGAIENAVTVYVPAEKAPDTPYIKWPQPPK